MALIRKILSNLSIAAVLFAFLTGQQAQAEAISEKFKNLKLNAEFKMAPGKTLKDNAVLMMPSPLGHHRMEVIVSVQDVLQQRGINTLAPSISLGNDDRRWYIDCTKPIKYTVDSIFDEIDFWIGWLKKRGARQITLLGHSASANYVSLYLTRRALPEVNGVIVLAPATSAYGRQGINRYEKRFKVSVKDVLARADRYITAGKGAQPMPEPTDYYFCPAAPVTPDAFVSLYRDMMSQDFPALWGTMAKPALLVIGTGDKRSPDIIQEAKRINPSGATKVVTIDKGGHFFKGLYTDKAVEAMIEFISQIQ